MNTTKKHIYATLGLGLNDDTGINLISKNACLICGKRDCENKHVSDLGKCKKFQPIISFEQFILNAKKEIYEREVPYRNEDGSNDYESDATSELLKSIADDEVMQTHFLVDWASGVDVNTSVDNYLIY